ncbi:MAG: FkbM family methyltransferase, partial [Tepidisphaeraceae bacterium]
MSWRVTVADAARPAMRLLPRGVGRILSLIGGGPHSQIWRDSRRRHRVYFDRSLNAWLSVDLAEWFGRLQYYSGRYYDHDVPHLIRTFLGAGDTFIDIGAHYGMHTLCAARHVGAAGTVFAFEPNPQSFSLLRAHLAINRIDNVIAENVGVSD